LSYLEEIILRPPGLASQFTHDWVGFEIGVAASVKKPIIVFEEYFDPIKFLIPFLTHFVLYRFDNDHARYIGKIVRDNMPTQKYLAPDVIKCPNPKCNAEEFGPGDIGYIPPGHNAWVVGDEPFVGVDFTGMETYAKKPL